MDQLLRAGKIPASVGPCGVKIQADQGTRRWGEWAQPTLLEYLEEDDVARLRHAHPKQVSLLVAEPPELIRLKCANHDH
jgi:hypothetical protein